MAIKAVIWDIGGVLERTEDFGPRRELAERLGWEMEPLMDLVFGNNDGHRVQLGQISYAAHWENVRRVLGQTEEQMKKTLQAFFAGDQLDDDLVEIIRRLRKDYSTAVLSNYSPILRKKINEEWRIGDAFDHLVISAEVGVKKPDPQIYQIVLDRIQSPAHQAVFVDDMFENVAAARDLGMYAVQFQGRDQAVDELTAILHKEA